MSLNSKIRSFEILAVAVRSEIEAADIYSKLYQQVQNELLQQKLKFLIFEEKKHRQILERLFSQRFPERKLVIPAKSFLPRVKVSLGKKTSVPKLFRAVLRAEKMSEDFYKESAEKAEEGESKKILGYLSRVERSHYFMIKSEMDLIERFPDYYDVEKFHIGQDMIHIGP